MRFALAFVVAAFAAIAVTPAEAQTRYPLHCRAGGEMNINVLGNASGQTEIVVLFAKATRTTGLSPGQCSWHDRVVNDREPSSFRIIFNARSNVDFRPRTGRRAGDRAELYVMDGAEAATLRQFYDVLKAGGSFEVQAHNPGRGTMNAITFRAVPPR